MPYLTPPIKPFKWEIKAWAIFTLIIYGPLALLLSFVVITRGFFMVYEGNFSNIIGYLLSIAILIFFIYFCVESIKEIKSLKKKKLKK